MKIKRRVEILIETNRVISISGRSRQATTLICQECPFRRQAEAFVESQLVPGVESISSEGFRGFGSMESVLELVPADKSEDIVSNTSIEAVQGGDSMKEETVSERSSSAVPVRSRRRWLFSLILPILFLMSPSDASAHITQLVPSSMPPGGPGFSLIIHGEELDPSDKVLWNGSPLDSSFVNETTLRAEIPAALIAIKGTVSISLQGFSEVLIFTIGQVDCNYRFDPDRFLFAYAEQIVTLNITVEDGCPWRIASVPNWMRVQSGQPSSGAGSGSTRFNVDENQGAFRQGLFEVAGRTIPVSQGTFGDQQCLMLFCYGMPVACRNGIAPGISTARKFRDSVLTRSDRGKRYTDLYYRFTAEAVSIAALNPSLILRTREMIERYKPVLDSFIIGEQVTLSRGDLQEIESLLETFSDRGGPQLRECIKGLREDLYDPQVHSEFNVTVVDGPKRVLPAATFGPLVRNTGMMIAPFGLLLLFVYSLTKTRFVFSALGSVRPINSTTARRLLCGAVISVLVFCGLSPGATLRSGGAVTRLNRQSASATPAAPSRFETLRADPHLLSSTFFGGVGTEEGNNVAVDQQGNIYLTGFTDSTNFPLSAAAQATFGGGKQDAFITKLDPSGSRILYSTFLGGNGQDNATGIAVDRAGNAYITGFTDSNNFPTKNAFQPTNRGNANAFVAKLDPQGRLIFSTLLGGSASDYGSCITVDSSGNIYVSGISTSSDLTTMNPIQSTLNGLTDLFVAKIDEANRLVYSTYVGGGALDAATGIAVDVSGNVYVTGLTSSIDFHTVNPFQANHAGGAFDGFAIKLNPAGTKVIYATYLGGGGEDRAFRIAVDQSGSAYITGDTDSANFPVVNAAQRLSAGTADAFVTKLSPSGTELVYSTYLGGDGIDGGTSITVDSTGSASVCGFTVSSNFPVSSAVQPVSSGGYDAFVTKLSASGSTLSYSTYLGGSGIDSAFGIATDSGGNVYVMGITDSANFPVVSALQTSNAGGGADLFVTRISTGPLVTGAVLEGKRLIVSGSGFDDGAKILVDGEKQKTANEETNPEGVLIGKKAGKFIAPGSTVTIQVRNSNGLISNSILFMHP